jgi:serine/threonine protein kinase
LAPDDRIGNYCIERELGSTSTGALYQVVHVVLPRRAVLKVTTQPLFARQLLREACILEALRHPGAPRVYESGLLADRRPWFVFEALEGVTLVERIMQAPLAALDATILVRNLASLLEHAHRRGVLHRGLLPDRVVLTPRRRFPLCVPDWTDARTHDAAASIPHVPTPGSRHYVAPELIRGDAVDDRADVYALGVIGYLALAGTHPTGRPLGEVAPAAPRELAGMIESMLAVDRYDRPSSAEVVADLDWLASALAPVDEPQPPVEDVVLVDTDGVPATLPRIRRPRWTPTYTAVTSDFEKTVAGEITTRRS